MYGEHSAQCFAIDPQSLLISYKDRINTKETKGKNKPKDDIKEGLGGLHNQLHLLRKL